MTTLDSLYRAPFETIATGIEATERAIGRGPELSQFYVAMIAALLLGIIAYELHDETFDDDLEDSLIESRPFLVVLLVADLAVIGWWIL